MIEVSIRRGWKALVLDAIIFASRFDVAWGFHLTSARRRLGLLLVDATYDKQEPAAVEAFLSWRAASRFRSQWTCEGCGQPGRLRVGRYRSRVFCSQHAYLCGELLPDLDGKVFDIENVRFSPMYDDPERERIDILKVWSEGKAPMRDVCDWLAVDRADVYYTSHELGFGIPLVENDDDETRAAEIVRLIGGRPDGAKH